MEEHEKLAGHTERCLEFLFGWRDDLKILCAGGREDFRNLAYV